MLSDAYCSQAAEAHGNELMTLLMALASSAPAAGGAGGSAGGGGGGGGGYLSLLNAEYGLDAELAAAVVQVGGEGVTFMIS